MLLYDFDLARFFMKEEVEGVFASEANLVDTMLKVNPQTIL